jgi:hypothetical protein
VTELSHEEITAQIEAELARLRVADVLLHTVSTVVSLAYRHLDEDDRDLEQVRLALEALKVLVPLLEHDVPDGLLEDFRRVTASIELGYVNGLAG